MPGLEEELWYRGIFLYFLNESFGKHWTVFGAKMGWGALVTTLLFGLSHGLSLEKDMAINFDLASVISTGIIGFVFVWAREKCGSIVPGILGHNLFNFVQQF